MRGVKKHIRYKNGRWKTICTSNVLAFFGISPAQYHYSESNDDLKRILRKHGYAVRSRFSSIPKNCSVGKLKKWLQANAEPGHYMVTVPGHALLLNSLGTIVVDTAPRKRDRRIIDQVSLVYPNGNSRD